MLEISYSSPKAIRAIHNLKVSVQKRKLDWVDFVSQPAQELKAKKIYMQTDAFWEDEHNKQMSILSEKLISLRDKISKSIEEHNLKPKVDTFVQGINGFARVKHFLDKNPDLHFWNEVSITNRENFDYRIAKTQLYNQARNYKSKIGR